MPKKIPLEGGTKIIKSKHSALLVVGHDIAVPAMAQAAPAAAAAAVSAAPAAVI